MEFYYVITSSTVLNDSDLKTANMSRRKVDTNTFAVQIWSTKELANKFLNRMPKGSDLKLYKVERSTLLKIMKEDGSSTKVELDAESF